MNYGIPVLPATGGGILLTTVGVKNNNWFILAIGLILLATTLFGHINLRKNEK